MDITLQLMNVDDKSLLIRLMELYNYEFSIFSNDDINEYGFYGYTVKKKVRSVLENFLSC